jgi:Protein of unknown function (DUF2510)
MTSQPPAGWYPDPADASGQRWWDGAAWSTSVAPGIPQPAIPQPVGASTGYDGSVAGTTLPAAGAQPGPSPYTYPTAMRGQVAPSGASVRSRNHYAFYALGVVAIYLVIAMTTRVVLFGIFPALLSYRSLRNREPLAPVAIGAAALAIIVSASLVFGH